MNLNAQPLYSSYQADICRFTGLQSPYLSYMININKDPTISNFSSRRRAEVYSVLQSFFNKIDKKEITLDDIARLVLISKATARAANSKRRTDTIKLLPDESAEVGIEVSSLYHQSNNEGKVNGIKPVIRKRRKRRQNTFQNAGYMNRY